MTQPFEVGDRFVMKSDPARTMMIVGKQPFPNVYYIIVKSDFPRHRLKIAASAFERSTLIAYKKISA